jgi:hypothetical protein
MDAKAAWLAATRLTPPPFVAQIAAILSWFANGGLSRVRSNDSEKEARLHQIMFSPAQLKIVAIGGHE